MEDFVLIPKHLLGAVEEYVVRLLCCLPNGRRLSVMNNFCKHCGNKDPQCRCQDNKTIQPHDEGNYGMLA